MGLVRSRQSAKLIDQPVVIYQRRHEPGLGTDETADQEQRQVRGPRVKEAGDEDIGGAFVGDAAGVEEKVEVAVGFGEAAGAAEGVDDGA